MEVTYKGKIKYIMTQNTNKTSNKIYQPSQKSSQAVD